jgi:long-chain acyl-CoA synthetase
VLAADSLRHAATIRPQHLAVVDGERSLTYAQLAARTRRLAWALRSEIGLEPGDRFGFLCANRLEFVEVLMAAAAAGVVCVPLHYRLSPYEIADIATDADLRAVFAETALEDKLNHGPAFERGVVWLGEPDGDDYSRLLAGPVQDLAPRSADEVMLQMYTSGTTGRPKGVMLSQGNVMANAWTMLGESAVAPGDRYLSTAPLCHLAAGSRVFLLVHATATHVIHPGFDPERIVCEMADSTVNAALLVPAMIRRVLKAAGGRSLRGQVRLITYGTAPMPLDLLAEALTVLGCDFQQAYGLTEASPNLTVLQPEEHVGPAPRLGSVGRESRGVHVRVVDDEDRDVAPGEVGEIVARGPNIMVGYWRRPEETAAALRGGWLRTGDLATVDEDRYVYLVDRKKDMLVSGGFNVYPREIEIQIERHPLVEEAAVIGIGDDRWGEVPVAFVVTRGDIPATELEDLCRARLAGFKVPHAFYVIDELPRTALAKIDKRSLRERLPLDGPPTVQL